MKVIQVPKIVLDKEEITSLELLMTGKNPLEPVLNYVEYLCTKVYEDNVKPAPKPQEEPTELFILVETTNYDEYTKDENVVAIRKTEKAAAAAALSHATQEVHRREARNGNRFEVNFNPEVSPVAEVVDKYDRKTVVHYRIDRITDIG